MGEEPQSLGANSITADELRQLIESRNEDDYLLIDVRQPEEYEVGHLPGAKLLPAVDLEEADGTLELAPHTVLYCHTGIRSKRAADALVQRLSRGGIYALDGGIEAWRGRTLEDFPNVHAFDGAGSLHDVLIRSLELEKGAHRLYEMLCDHFASSRLLPILEELLHAEVAHGRVLYNVLRRSSTKDLVPFDELFDSLTGDILENGAYLDEMLLVAGSLEPDDEPALLELALGVEYMAYDLYRSLAHRFEEEAQRQVFVKLAAQEKRHVNFVLDALGRLAKDQTE